MTTMFQGWLLTPDNMTDFMQGVTKGLARLEAHIARYDQSH